MDQNITKLANSVNVAERRQALKQFLANIEWTKSKELVALFLNDPDKSIVKEMFEAVITKCPEKYLSEIKILAIHLDKDIRIKALEYLCNLDSFRDIDILLERMPLEDAAIAIKLKAAIKKSIEKDTIGLLRPLLICSGSDNEAVRKEALAILVTLKEPIVVLKEFYIYLQAISPTVREKVLTSAKKDSGWFINSTKELLFQEQDTNVRLQALNLLTYFAYEQLENILLAEMRHTDWTLKHYAIKTLANLKSEKAKPLLIEAMEDKELSIQAIMALDSYRQQEIGITFLRKLGKSSDDEQLALLKGIGNLAAGDKRYIEPLLVFAAHDVCKLPAKKLALEVVGEICKKTNTPRPAKADEIEAQIKKMIMGDIPDLGLKFVE